MIQHIYELCSLIIISGLYDVLLYIIIDLSLDPDTNHYLIYELDFLIVYYNHNFLLLEYYQKT